MNLTNLFDNQKKNKNNICCLLCLHLLIRNMRLSLSWYFFSYFRQFGFFVTFENLMQAFQYCMIFAQWTVSKAKKTSYSKHHLNIYIRHCSDDSLTRAYFIFLLESRVFLSFNKQNKMKNNTIQTSGPIYLNFYSAYFSSIKSIYV